MLAQSAMESSIEADISEVLLHKLETKIVFLLRTKFVNSAKSNPSDAELAAVYHLNSGGRRVRGRLAIHACLSLGLSKEDTLCIAAAVELLHNASLIHDDLQDRDTLRHGMPTVWVKFGKNVAICAGDLMLSTAYVALCSFSRVQVLPSLLALVHERAAIAIQGQCADLASQIQPIKQIDAYEKIVIAKSGSLLSLPLELALLASGKQSWSGEARTAAEAFSLAYQVADDLTDLQLDAQMKNLNIVFVLEAASNDQNAIHSAYQLGTEYVDTVVDAAQKIPCNAGDFLLQLSHELRKFFNAKL
jgi:geranylgeranyl pyrophosphate synthase